ncbi:MAG: hypothetical protein M3Q39_02180 [Actinomycetota bacterium]|nr:hypothetical protein [Actinomycetota bacterium]
MARDTGTQPGEARVLVRMKTELRERIIGYALKRAETDPRFAGRALRPQGSVKVSTTIVILVEEAFR